MARGLSGHGITRRRSIIGTRYEARGDVAVVTLDNPPVNGLGYDVRAAVAAGGHHLQGGLDADYARQALGAAGAGQEAQRHFRQAQAGRRNGDAVVGAERDLKAAAQGRAVDRGDHRLG